MFESLAGVDPVLVVLHPFWLGIIGIDVALGVEHSLWSGSIGFGFVLDVEHTFGIGIIGFVFVLDVEVSFWVGIMGFAFVLVVEHLFRPNIIGLALVLDVVHSFWSGIIGVVIALLLLPCSPLLPVFLFRGVLCFLFLCVLLLLHFFKELVLPCFRLPWVCLEGIQNVRVGLDLQEILWWVCMGFQTSGSNLTPRGFH